MVRSTLVSLLLLTQGLGNSPVRAQAEASKPGEPAPSAGYKVAFWYDRSRPAQTFRYQVYDLRKGAYDPQAVGRWLDLIGARFPGYAAYVSDVPTVPGAGRDDQEALQAAIEQERRTAGTSGRTSLPIPSAATVDQTPRPTTPAPGQERPRPNVTNYVPMPNYGQLMHPSITGYGPGGPARRSSIGGPLGGSLRFGTNPSSSSSASPFPYPYPRPHP